MTATAERVSFYFSAHPDDWQLFMNPPASQDVLDKKCRCVFVHMSAGDAGFGLEHDGGKPPFYLARENGAEAAIRYIADANERSPAEAGVSVVTFKGHAIRGVRYRNTAAYFLRLPDGSPAGCGYATTGYQSLTRLANGEIDTVTAVDGTAVYRAGMISRRRCAASSISSAHRIARWHCMCRNQTLRLMRTITPTII